MDDVVGGRALGDNEPLGDLTIGEPLRDHDGNLLLAARQDGPGGVRLGDGQGRLGRLIDVKRTTGLPGPGSRLITEQTPSWLQRTVELCLAGARSWCPGQL